MLLGDSTGYVLALAMLGSSRMRGLMLHLESSLTEDAATVTKQVKLLHICSDLKQQQQKCYIKCYFHVKKNK